MSLKNQFYFDYLYPVALQFQSKPFAGDLPQEERLVTQDLQEGILSPTQFRTLAKAHGEICKREDHSAIVRWLESKDRVRAFRAFRNRRTSAKGKAKASGESNHSEDEVSDKVYELSLICGIINGLAALEKLGNRGFPPFQQPALVFFQERASSQGAPRKNNGGQSSLKGYQHVRSARIEKPKDDSQSKSKRSAKRRVEVDLGQLDIVQVKKRALSSRQEVQADSDLVPAMLRDFCVLARRIELYAQQLGKVPSCDGLPGRLRGLRDGRVIATLILASGFEYGMEVYSWRY